MRWLGWIAATIAVLPPITVMLGIVAMNTPPGRQAFERALPLLTGGEVAISGLSGRFPDALQASRVEISDAAGNWLVLQQIDLRWSPARLLRGELRIDRMDAARVTVVRLPAYPPDTGETHRDLPFTITLAALRAARVELSPHVLGSSATLDLSASGHIASRKLAELSIRIVRQDREGRYRAEVRVDPSRLRVDLDIDEPAQGLLAAWSGLSEFGRLSLAGWLDGPPSSAETRVQLIAGALKGELKGRVDLDLGALDLSLSAAAPAMRWRPDLSWEAAVLNASIRGPYLRPTATGTLGIDRLQAAESSVRRISAEVEADATGEARLRATLDHLRIPGPKPDLFADTPVALDVDTRLERPERPLSFNLRHPLLHAHGRLDTAPEPRGDALVALPDIHPFATLGGIEARGKLELKLHTAPIGDATRVDGQGALYLAGGEPIVVGLLGERTNIDASITLKGGELALSPLTLDGKSLRFSADGRYTPSQLDFHWTTRIKDLSAVAPRISGRFAADGRLTGTPRELSFNAGFGGEIASTQWAAAPFHGEIQLRGLPYAAAGALRAKAAIAGSTVDAMFSVSLLPSRDLHIVVDRADWKSTHARGAFTLPADFSWPSGNLEWRIDRLGDFTPLLGEPLAGSALGTLTTYRRAQASQAALRLEAHRVAFAGVLLDSLNSSATLTEIGNNPRLEGRIGLTDYAAGTVAGNGQVDFAGHLNAVKLDLSSTATQTNGSPVALHSTAVVDATTTSLAVSTLNARWRHESLRLLAPARFQLGEGARVDSLRLGWRQAELQIAGRLSPALDLDAKLHALPADLAGLIYPDVSADGRLNGEARLAGLYNRPRGRINLRLTGFRLRQGTARGLPPADVHLSADLDGAAAQLDAKLHGGPYLSLSARGRAPMDPTGPLDLLAEGRLELRVLDPLLTPHGQRLRGLVNLKTRLQGTRTQPLVAGSIQFMKGEMLDYALGVRMTDIVAQALLDGDRLRVTRFDGKMNPGRVTALGSLGWHAPGLPIDVKIIARNARALSGERLSVTLNSDLDLQGAARDKVTINGNIGIRRAEIRIPERMPARIAVLDVRKPGEIPPSAPKPGPDFALNLTLDAPGAVFVRGRGLDAELGGKVRLLGTARNPEPTGRFVMRRGEFKLAGRTLTFRKGEVGFDGGTLTNPALDFIATTTSPNVTATLTVGGTANKPNITLSSVPDLPQDEVLSHLLFGRNAASLGPLEMAQIASALASLTGVTGGMGDPLEMVRQGLRLDRLSMGNSKAGPTLEAGRYIAPGVYLGAKQGFTGAAPQAAVQIEVTESLKVEGTVGTGSSASSQAGTSSVGVIYQFEY